MPKYRVASISDIHAPLTCPKRWKWAVDKLKDFKPDAIVINGDWFEGKASSRHEPDARHAWTVTQEFDTVAEQIRELNETFPESHRVFLYGNHNDNLMNYQPGRKDTDFYYLVQSLRESRINPGLKGWHVIDKYRYDKSFYIGQLCFRHAYSTSAAGLARELYEHCPYMGLMVTGHTHRPKDVTQHEHVGAILPYWTANTGTLADPERMHYADRQNTTRWGSGVLLAEVMAPGLKEGRYLYSEPRWSAVVELFGVQSKNSHDVRLR